MGYVDVNTHTNDSGPNTSGVGNTIIAGGFGNSTHGPTAFWPDLSSIFGQTDPANPLAQPASIPVAWIALALVAFVALHHRKKH